MKTTSLPKLAAARPATLHDVARSAGVSLITASRALSNPALVSPKTIEKVRLAVDATGYLPNLLAGGLRSRRSMTVGALVPAISVQQFLPTVQALTETLYAAGYQVILGQSGYDHSREEALLQTMLARQPDGIVVTGLVRSEKARDTLRRLAIPVVETWDLGEHPVDMLVGFSHQRVGAAVADYLRGKGWERVGIATGDDHRAGIRRRAFEAAVGRPVPTSVVPAPSSLALGRRAATELLEQAPGIQAVYCSSDQLAQGVMVEALSRGLRVPQDLAVCGFGDADFAAHTEPSLTSVQVDGEAIGRHAAGLILARCTGQPTVDPVLDVGFRIVERQSTGGL
ncbi:LacI family DNA-binding transcriptional regulator [Xylophilus sp. GOD-11R]|uniref:LacI family DNA-binding transcriptional regulator n=1 Tax=Xylophilus sp. GOD-11R TaxID=3089814 RepID=UPI00298C9242|nr:LacI family DNA-binding transcriptional regulator [Xylophilus sp. GOD-11R]WPB59128.1 LacI family DNA-binding transcriptional regulator [Xylophilus sp. GOD-11R]